MGIPEDTFLFGRDPLFSVALMDSLWKKKKGNTPSYYYQESMRWGNEEHMTGVQPMNVTLLEY